MNISRDLNRIARAAMALCALVAGASHAGVADIANSPLATQADGTLVRSNVMFILDDSGSMGSNYLPDDAPRSDVCFGSNDRNLIFYDPNRTYAPPLTATGASMPDASFTAAWTDGYNTSAGTVDLSNNNPETPKISNVRFLWAVRKATASSTSCNASDFTITRVTNALTDTEKKNYANWFSYYRTRMLAIRAGAGFAFAKIDPSRFRVGFSKISEYSNGGADGTGFLNVRNYDGGTQKADFFSRLYSTSGTSTTPLRPALARAGRYFANKLSGQTDPIQYACQRNYTILSTDGYWNEGSMTHKDLNGKTGVGNTDAGTGVARPMRDEGNKGAGYADTLADVAQYYYVNDLRTSALNNCSGAEPDQDVCEKETAPQRKDGAKGQFMTTFTMGLGLNGTLTYDKDYETQTSGDFVALKNGTKVWPQPVSNTITAVDDLWHAAVNGRGTYYSAKNSTDMADSLAAALAAIDKQAGSGAAAATSSLTPTSGDDWLFVPSYNTNSWDGTVTAYKVLPATGAVTGAAVWSSADRLKGQTSRKILFKSGNSLVEFTKANLSTAGLLTQFDGLCTTGAEKLSQCTKLTTNAKANATSDNLIAFLRGGSTYEQSAASADNKVFRTRVSPMGDIVNSGPIYVRKSPLQYSENNHAAYVATTKSEADKRGYGVLYVGANDGMLHAIKVADSTTDTTGGTELWAYVPSMVMANMYRLADVNYETNHRPFVDAPPVVSDVFDGTNWRTILVGGLGNGGRGYYALDITDPASPTPLWEFTNDNLGYTFGNPVVTKNKAGTWVVLFSSGYNNVNPGDGNGRLYVVNALTGARIGSDIATKIGTANAGSTGTPSNLGRINAWVDDDKLGVASRVYGGDMLGNVWRFDFDDNVAPSGNEAVLLGQTAGSTQPITTRPVLTEIVSGNYKYAVISVGTGRYLGVPDVGDKSVQSIYTFKDELGTTGLGALRASTSGMVKQTLAADRSGLANGSTVDWAVNKGWYVDLSLSQGERVNVDFDQQLNQLIVASNIPTPTVCSPGGTSWLYFLDVGTGKPLKSYYSSVMTVGVTVFLTSGGTVGAQAVKSDKTITPYMGAENTGAPAGTLRRTSWRELVN